MSTVSFLKQVAICKYQIRELASILRIGDSVQVYSTTPNDTHALISFLFQDHNTRRVYMECQNQDVLLSLPISENADGIALDTLLLTEASRVFGRQFDTLNELIAYTTSENIRLILLLSGENDSLLRYAFSYSFLFHGNVQYILLGNQITDYFTNSIDLSLPDSYVRETVLDRLNEYSLTFSIEEVLEAAEHSLLKIDHAIISLLIKKREMTSVTSPQISLDEKKPLHENKVQNSAPEPERQSSPNKTSPRPLSESLPTPAVQRNPVRKPLSNVALTPREQLLFDALYEKHFISRNEIAQIVWGAEASDDAIDQVISRLRRKFVQAGYSKTYITSKKGEGIVLGSQT